jgi:hypothetical protein
MRGWGSSLRRRSSEIGWCPEESKSIKTNMNKGTCARINRDICANLSLHYTSDSECRSSRLWIVFDARRAFTKPALSLSCLSRVYPSPSHLSSLKNINKSLKFGNRTELRRKAEARDKRRRNRTRKKRGAPMLWLLSRVQPLDDQTVLDLIEVEVKDRRT